MKKTTPNAKVALETTLNAALYAAAKKAGMVEDLYRAQVEIAVSMREGKVTNLYVYWEQELRELPDFAVPYAAIERAEKWLVAYGKTHNLPVAA